MLIVPMLKTIRAVLAAITGSIVVSRESAEDVAETCVRVGVGTRRL